LAVWFCSCDTFCTLYCWCLIHNTHLGKILSFFGPKKLNRNFRLIFSLDIYHCISSVTFISKNYYLITKLFVLHKRIFQNLHQKLKCEWGTRALEDVIPGFDTVSWTTLIIVIPVYDVIHEDTFSILETLIVDMFF
jgi:hypothetical protein